MTILEMGISDERMMEMQERGIYGKYKIERTDGKPMKKGFRFVLSPEHDVAALEALKTYANKTENKQLSDELKYMIYDYEQTTQQKKG